MLNTDDPEFIKIRNILMKFIAFISLTILLGVCGIYLTSCQALPQLFQSAEDIANDDIIEITISKGLLQKETDLQVIVDMRNKEPTEPVTTK